MYACRLCEVNISYNDVVGDIDDKWGKKHTYNFCVRRSGNIVKIAFIKA